MSWIRRFRALFNPDMYHGWNKERRYFEGWYYKLVSKDESIALAIIPGVAMDESGQKHAFIQVLDGKNLKADYIKFDFSEFEASQTGFNIRIAKNNFNAREVILDNPNIKGHLIFSLNVPWPNSVVSPGIMGPFSFFPFMECYHGIVSMDHVIDGKLNYNNQQLDFSGGRGYMEKDWGHSFPSAYFWMQSNHFSQLGISVKASVAKIPWLGTSFVGFIAGVWFKDRLVQFTTYNFSKLKKSFANKDSLHIVMENRKYKLEIMAERSASTELASPIGGFMDGRVNESMTDLLHVKLLDKRTNSFILDDVGRNAGLEVAGNIEEIILDD